MRRRKRLMEEISLDGKLYAIVGVMPAEFKFSPFWATKAEFWAPLALGPRSIDRGGNSLRIFARLAPGVGLEGSRAELATITARLEQQYPGTNRDAQVVPLKEKVFLLGFSSEAKSYVVSGLPSSPLWQYEHRTPSDLVNPTITGLRREPGQSLGKTCRFFGFSGQVQGSCALLASEEKATKHSMPVSLTTNPIARERFIEMPSCVRGNGHGLWSL